MNNSRKPSHRGSRFAKRSHTKRRPSSSYNRNNRRGGRNRGFSAKKLSHDTFINKRPTARIEETYTPQHTFADFKLHPEIIKNLKHKGYIHPTRIQDMSIPHIMEGKDVVGLSNTGSGKTAAFVLPIIHKIVKNQLKENALIITPTRELTQQIQEEFRQFAHNMRIRTTLCVGGLNIRRQMRELKRNPHVVIGTPGRLKDLITRGYTLNAEHITTLVLDEVDHMLDIGFLPDTTFIIKTLPEKKQSLCFSATMQPDITRFLSTILKNPETISVRTSETGEHIAQDVIRARSESEKLKELTRMLSQHHFEKVLIFGAMKRGVQNLADTLSKNGFSAIAIHGNKTQPQRQRALDAFKKGRVKILVATDVAARGLDIPNVSHVINFDQPNTKEEYIHRIGRTGRAGKPGQAYTFIH